MYDCVLVLLYCLHIQLAMKIDPDYGEVYFNYGNLLSDIGEFEAAAARYIHR